MKEFIPIPLNDYVFFKAQFGDTLQRYRLYKVVINMVESLNKEADVIVKHFVN